MIVDSSAIAAILLKESGFLAFAEAIDGADFVRMSAGTLIELSTVIDRHRYAALSSDLDELLDAIAIVIEPVTERQARIARDANRKYGRRSGHRARLNFGDCFAYALTRDLNEPLLFKGDDFTHTDIAPALA